MSSPEVDQRTVAMLLAGIHRGDRRSIARAISLVEDQAPEADAILSGLDPAAYDKALILGITGPPGAGKSTLTNRLIGHLLKNGDSLGVIAVDPSSPLSGGAILGDRIRMMEHAANPRVLVRSMASRGRSGGLGGASGSGARIMAAAGCRTVIIETVGVGQAELEIIALADLTMLIFAPGLGDEIQAMKAGLLELADILVVNKADLPGAPALTLDLEAAGRSRRRDCGAGIANPAITPAPDRKSELPQPDSATQEAKPQQPPANGDYAPPVNAAVVISTSAVTGQGVEQLSELILTRADQLRASGNQIRRRQAARRREIVNWAIDLLRPRLLSAVSEDYCNLVGDPHRRARELLARLGNDLFSPPIRD